MKIVINSHKQNSLARTHLLESMEMKKEFLSFMVIKILQEEIMLIINVHNF